MRGGWWLLSLARLVPGLSPPACGEMDKRSVRSLCRGFCGRGGVVCRGGFDRRRRAGAVLRSPSCVVMMVQRPSLEGHKTHARPHEGVGNPHHNKLSLSIFVSYLGGQGFGLLGRRANGGPPSISQGILYHYDEASSSSSSRPPPHTQHKPCAGPSPSCAWPCRCWRPARRFGELCRRRRRRGC